MYTRVQSVHKQKAEKDLINKKFDEKLPAEEVIYFLAVFEFKFSC